MMEFPRFVDIAPNTPPYSTQWGLDNPSIVSIMADQLAYTLKVGAKTPEGNYHLTIAVAGNIPDQRTPAKTKIRPTKINSTTSFKKRIKTSAKNWPRARASLLGFTK